MDHETGRASMKKLFLLIFLLMTADKVFADTHVYSKVVDVPRLSQEINDNMGYKMIKNNDGDVLNGFINYSSPTVTIVFDNVLLSSETDHLDDIVSSHTATPLIDLSLDKPVMSISGFNSTLGSGTTFQHFIPQSDIKLIGISATIVTAVEGSEDHMFCCGNGDGAIHLTVPADATAGQVFSNKMDLFVMVGSTISLWMDTEGVPTYTVNMECDYIIQ